MTIMNFTVNSVQCLYKYLKKEKKNLSREEKKFMCVLAGALAGFLALSS